MTAGQADEGLLEGLLDQCVAGTRPLLSFSLRPRLRLSVAMGFKTITPGSIDLFNGNDSN